MRDLWCRTGADVTFKQFFFLNLKRQSRYLGSKRRTLRGGCPAGELQEYDSDESAACVYHH